MFFLISPSVFVFTVSNDAQSWTSASRKWNAICYYELLSKAFILITKWLLLICHDNNSEANGGSTVTCDHVQMNWSRDTKVSKINDSK